ncbi:MAG TPA: hypothetical protein VFZ78_02695 [Flavisolibacter sp.]
MKRVVLFAAVVLSVFISCRKQEVPPGTVTPGHPQMRITNLGDSVVTFGKGASFNLDGLDGKDVYFGTMLVGDAVYQQDKYLWLVSTSFYASLPVNEHESIPVMQYNDSIRTADFNGYNWYNASTIVLAQKVIGTTQPPFWAGDWKEASHRYIPVQLIRPDGFYNGWVEVSFSIQQERLVLHRAAVCRVPSTTIAAGN